MEHPENSGEYKGLAVNKGIEQPSSVNPYLKRKPKKRQLSVAEFVEGIVKGDITILSQAVTLVESVKPEHQVVAQEVIEKCLPHSGNSVRIGISGVPGAGKSTSIDVFGLHVLEKGGKLAVLAIDPSSERSKGSILGDKTRMEQLSVHPKSFIRPSPSAGSLGGVAHSSQRATPPKEPADGLGRMNDLGCTESCSIRVLSPKILPLLRSLLGSMANTASLPPFSSTCRPNTSMDVLFPAPGTPLIPIRIELPENGRHFSMISCETA